MLPLRKRGFVMINTMIIVSLIITLSCLMFNIIRNNTQIRQIGYLESDIYSVDLNEENIIYEFMDEINIYGNQIKKDSDFSEADLELFENDFKKEIGENKLIYIKSEDKMILKIYGKYDALRIRELKRKIENDKIVLIPTMNFYDTNTSNEYGSN